MDAITSTPVCNGNSVFDHQDECCAEATSGGTAGLPVYRYGHVDTSWMPAGRCNEVGVAPFFPEPGESAAPGKAICAACEVRPDCLAWALATGEAYGILGGLEPSERAEILAANPQLGPDRTTRKEQLLATAADMPRRALTIPNLARRVGASRAAVAAQFGSTDTLRAQVDAQREAATA